MSTENTAAALQAIGESAAESIAEMVAALECDYERLADLREARDELRKEFDDDPANAGADFLAWARNQHSLSSDDVDELLELEAAAGDCADEDEARERINEDALSVEVRSGWTTPSETLAPEEFCLLLATGGPAVRIVGALGSNCEPRSARLEVQDWFTPWTEYTGDAVTSDALLAYARCFYYGEG